MRDSFTRTSLVISVRVFSQPTPADLFSEDTFQSQKLFAPGESVLELCKLDLAFCFFRHCEPVEDLYDQHVPVYDIDVSSDQNLLNLEDLGARQHISAQDRLDVLL